MEIVQINPKQLTPYERNNKKHSPEQIEAIKNSITEFGFIQPVVIDAQNVIIIGHARTEAAKALKMKTIPVVIAQNFTEHQIKRLRMLDNRLGDMGMYDIENVLSEIDDLGDADLKELFQDLIPEAEEDEGQVGGGGAGDEKQLQDMVIVVTKEQRQTIEKAIEAAKKIPFADNENCNANGNALFYISRAFISNK